MGAKNVSAAFVMWPHLPHGAFRLLVGMALQSLDQPSKEGRPARVYFGGEKAMVEVFGRSRRSMYQALEKLRTEGAVEVLDTGRHGHRAVYKLALDPVADAAKGADSRTHKGADSRTEGCENSHVKGAKTRTPRNHEGGDEESREGNSPPQGSTCTAPVDNSEQDNFAAMDLAECHHRLIERHGTRVHDVIAQHQQTCTGCPDPVRHLLATPALRVIQGGKTA